MMRLLAPDVYLLDGLRLANVYLIVAGDGLTLIDAGMPGDAGPIAAQIRQAGYALTDVRNIVLTHAHGDHTGAVGELVERSGAHVLAHRDEIPYIERRASLPGASGITRTLNALSDRLVFRGTPCTVDRSLDDGDEIGGGAARLRVVHTPGHTPGSISLYQPERGIVFCGDALFNAHPLTRKPGLQFPLRLISADSGQVRDSTGKLARLDAPALCCGHGDPILIDAGERLRALLRDPRLANMPRHATRYPGIDALIQDLLQRMRGILGSTLAGLYLYGSLVMGDFDMATSDIDMLAVTVDDIDAGQAARLRAMHAALAVAYPHWDDRIEVQYLSVGALRTFKTQRSQISVISPGEPFNVKDAGIDWLINWYLVREYGVVVFGPTPEAFVPPISHAEFVRSARSEAHDWLDWAKAPRDRTGQSYAILTLCRALCASKTGAFVSKRQAVRWASQQFPQWAGLVQDALVWRQFWQEKGIDHAATFPETVRFIHFALDQIDRDAGRDSNPYLDSCDFRFTKCEKGGKLRLCNYPLYNPPPL